MRNRGPREISRFSGSASTKAGVTREACRYAAEVSGVDDGVGHILAALEANGIDDETLVIFTADQGLAAGQSGFWGMGDHTRPLTGFDWTTHVPLIYRYPKHIQAGGRSKILVSNYDFLPTMLDFLGLKEKAPQKPPSPVGMPR